MYTSYIGKKFLRLYKNNNGLPSHYSAKQFFEEVMFPLFFEEEKHLMHVGNSPFFQKPTADSVATHGSKSKAQLHNLTEKIEEGLPSGAIFVGYGAENIEATSSGQMTSIDLNISDEEMYASWIGQALAVGVSGALVLLIDGEEVLQALFEGWFHYRNYLKQTKNLKDKQIETWNGNWLNHVFGKKYVRSNPMAQFTPEMDQSTGKLAIKTIDWVKIIFALSRKYPEQTVTAYVYSLSQTNTTLGFINLNLPKVRKLIQLKNELYNIPGKEFNDDFEQLYHTFYTLRTASQLGVIGLQAIEPQDLRKFMPKGSTNYAQGKDFKFTNTQLKPKKQEENQDFIKRQEKANNKFKNELINFQIFKIWIIAMLNNRKELNTLAEKTAQALIDFENNSQVSSSGRGKSTQGRLSEEVQSSKSLREFIDKLTELMKKHTAAAVTFKQVKDTILELPPDLFPLFVTLIRFEYQYKKSI